MLDYVTECDIFSFEEASKRFENVAERYSHLHPVSLHYHKGEFILSYAKKHENNEDNYCE